MQTLALHKALALLRMHLLDPVLAPNAVEEAVRELEEATVPLRLTPLRRVEKTAPSPEQREAMIAVRMASGMTREQAETHVSTGSRIGPDGQDFGTDTPGQPA
jgi:hypothetical protein